MLLLVLHSGAFPEETVAESVCVLPTVIETEDEESLIFGCFTVMVQVLDTPSTFAVILAVPCLTAVTVLSVDQNGNITALKKGRAYVYAREDGIKTSCVVTVSEPNA